MEPLKNSYGPDVPRRIAGMIRAAHPSFPSDKFLKDVLRGYEELELTPRARRISSALKTHLPSGYEAAMNVLLASLGPAADREDMLGAGMGGFLYLPHVFFVAENGLDHFALSMKAQYELTKRFTAEFSIRAFLLKHPKETLKTLAAWTKDPSPHVRRLVSEGTRPRLPWAARLPAFQKDPTPAIALLECLKDDPAEYVRRSVANHLNDIGKDNPETLISLCARWMKAASAERRRLIERALRSEIKRGNRDALALLGFGDASGVALLRSEIVPEKAAIGSTVSMAFRVTNRASAPRQVMADFRVHYVKAGGASRPKVFKLKSLALAPGESCVLGKNLSLREMTTRRHHPGFHRVELQLNGRLFPAGGFTLLKPSPKKKIR